MSPSTRYTNDVRERFGYYATWLPNIRIELGDVGAFDGVSFKRITSLTELKIPFARRLGLDRVDFTLTSSSGVSLDAKAGVAVGVGDSGANKGQLAIQFGEQGAFVFRARQCRVDELGDRLGLGATVVELCRAGMWDADWRIVDTIVHAESATVIVSNSANASLSLSAASPLELSALANVDAGISVNAQAGDVLHFIAAAGLSPMFKVIGVKQSLFAKLFGGQMTFGGPGEQQTTDAFEDEDPFEQV